MFYMSTSYSIFTEGLNHGHWVCLNSYLLSGTQFVLTETYRNESRTYFSAAFDKLCEIGTPAKATELSNVLQQKAAHEKWQNIWTIDIAAVQKLISKMRRFECHGYVLKSEVLLLEAGETDEIDEWLTYQDYAALSAEAQKRYQYHEWNDNFGWYKYFLLLLERTEWQCKDWKRFNQGYEDEIQDLRLVLTIS